MRNVLAMMARLVLAFSALALVALSPWPFPAAFALIASPLEPLLPLAAGLFTDTLYYVPREGTLPLFTLGGAIVTAIALLVRSRLSTGTIGR